ncbi:Ig-like domain-containing protein [bacterium]|nr:Ig-like domain-containing protein [bacterium]
MRDRLVDSLFRPRVGAIAALLALVLAIWGCTGDADEITGVLPPSGTGASTDVTGGVSKGGGQSGGATPSPTPTTNKTPTPTPSATPTAEETPATPFAINVQPWLAMNTLVVAPSNGASPLYPYTTTATVEVLLSNGHRQATAQWDTSDHAIATVDTAGLVSAGNTPGTVEIFATSLDGRASASVTLTVLSKGGAIIEVD